MVTDLELLACPADRGRLAPLGEGARCTACGREFRAVEGVLSLLPDELQQPGADLDSCWRDKHSEKMARDCQAEQYDRMVGLRLLSRLELPLMVRHVAPRAEAVVLDAGCGTGRLSMALAGRCRLLAVDFSLSSLVRCRQKLEGRGLRATLVQGDLTHLPVADGLLDGVASCQVLEHLPGAEMRQQAVKEIRRALRPGGSFTATAYHYNWATCWFGGREGYHPGGIFYHRFTLKEYRDLLGDQFELAGVKPLGGYVLLAHGRKPVQKVEASDT